MEIDRDGNAWERCGECRTRVPYPKTMCAHCNAGGHACPNCQQRFMHDPKNHKCEGQWESELAAAGVDPLGPTHTTTWVEECMAKQRG